MRHAILTLGVAVVGWLVAAGSVCAGPPPFAVVTLSAALDNTLYEDSTGSVSNGLGPNIFAGKTRFAGVRRAVIEFDLASVPANATIVFAQVTLNLTRAVTSGDSQSLHRVLASWGEGTSNTGDETLNPGGLGSPSTAGDATWLHRFFSGTTWAAPGGDFQPAPSATATVDNTVGSYTWSGPGLVADVQAWLNDPTSNHGWMVRGVEAGSANAKRYASKDHPTPSLRPKLTVGYTVPAPCPGDFNGDNTVNVLDLTIMLGVFGTTVTPGSAGDMNNDGTVNTTDLVLFLGAFGQPC